MSTLCTSVCSRYPIGYPVFTIFNQQTKGTNMDEKDRLETIIEVYEVIQDNFGYDIGNSAVDAFNLLGSISIGNVCELDEDDDLIAVLSDEFPQSHNIWDYIRLVE